MGIEADTKSPWNEGHIGTGRGYDGVTDSSIGQVGYNDAQCAVNIGSLGYMYIIRISLYVWWKVPNLNEFYKVDEFYILGNELLN